MKGNEMKLGLVLSATDKMSRVVEQATQKSNKSLQKLKKEAGEFSKKMTQIGAGIMAAGGAMGFAAYEGVKSVAEKAKSIQNLTQEMGNMTPEAIQTYQHMLEKAGLSQEVFAKGVGKLAKNMTEVKLGGSVQTERVFQALGLSVVDVHGKLKSTDEMMMQVTDRISKMKDGTAKTGLIMSLFGRSGKEMIPILNQGAKGFENEREELEKMHALLSGSQVQSLSKVSDKMDELKNHIEGMKNSLVANNLNLINGALNRVMAGLDKIGNWLSTHQNLVSKIAKLIPYIVGVGAVIATLGIIIRATMILQTTWAFISKLSSISLVDLRLRAMYAMDAIKGLGIAQKLTAAWTGIATGAQWLLNAAFIASPIGWIVLAVGALTVGIVLLWKKFAGFRAFLKTTWDVVKGFGNILKEYVIDRVKDLLAGLGNIGKAIALLFTGHFKAAGTTALEGIKQLSGYSATKKAISNSTKFVGTISNTYNKHLVTERAAQKPVAKSSAIYTPSAATAYGAPAASSSSPVIQYHQVINIASGTNQDDFVRALNAHKRDVIAVLDEYFKNKARVSY